MRPTLMRLHRLLFGALFGATLLAGCVASGADTHAWNSSYDYGVPGAVVSVKASVPYYPACGNEVLSFEGRRWYPFKPVNSSDLPAQPLDALPSASGASDASSSTAADMGAVALAAGPVGAVVAPGPGDDVGTLVIYENDLAYWESDSGTLRRWLTSHEIEYNWVC